MQDVAIRIAILSTVGTRHFLGCISFPTTNMTFSYVHLISFQHAAGARHHGMDQHGGVDWSAGIGQWSPLDLNVGNRGWKQIRRSRHQRFESVGWSRMPIEKNEGIFEVDWNFPSAVPQFPGSCSLKTWRRRFFYRVWLWQTSTRKSNSSLWRLLWWFMSSIS